VVVAWSVAAALALALVLDLGFRRIGSGTVSEGAWLESGEESAAQVRLAEGVTVALDARTRVHFVRIQRDAVRVDLERGGMKVEAPAAKRSIVVDAAGYEIRAQQRVLVQRLAFAIEVRAERGDAEVVAPEGAVYSIREGETWKGALGEALAPAASSSAAAAASVATMATPPQPARTPPVAAAGPSVVPGVQPESARALFEEAQRARTEGRTTEAARLFDKLRSTYRQDPRAGLSAFELGRLRLEALGDARGAEDAFRDAVALAPGSPFREDAEARLVQALAREGDHAGCLAASQAYLAKYPHGAYRKAVIVYCGSP